MVLSKYHGLGNDYLVYDPGKNGMELNPARIRLLCDRNFGVGSDGLLYGPFFEDGKPRVRIFNPDGGEAEKSGNGARIFAKYLKDAGYVNSPSFTLGTLGGDVEVAYLSEDGALTRTMMGRATFRSVEIPVAGEDREVVGEEMDFGGRQLTVTCVSIGNPHCVIPMEEITQELACELGPAVERSPHFPNRINVQFLQSVDRNTIRLEIYERGAGYTLASGSSSCGAASAACRLGIAESPVTVRMPGGELLIEVLPDWTLYMTGRVGSVGTVCLDASFVKELEALA